MKKFRLAFVFALILFALNVAAAQVAAAQPVTPAKPADMAAPMKVAPVKVTKPTVAAPIKVVAKPMVAVPTKMLSAPVAAPVKVAQPEVVAAPKTSEAPAKVPEIATPKMEEPVNKVAVVAATPKTETPVWKTAGFWIGVVGGPLLSIVLAILVAFGVIRKKWLDYLREKEIIKIADKAVTNIEAYVESTEAKWDDILAQVLRAVVTRIGELTEGEKGVVTSIVKDREAQAKIISEK